MSFRTYCHLNYDHRQYLITEAPTNLNLWSYINILHKYRVKILICLCECSYDQRQIESVGIKVISLYITDGSTPKPEIVQAWIQILQTTTDPIAVHCVSGLGRAPLMIAIALIEQGMKPLDTIDFIRKHRRGSFNSIQLDYVSNYKPSHKGYKCLHCNIL